MADKGLKGKVASVVGRENCSDAPEDRLLHAYDAMNRRYLPDLVVHPGSPEQVSALFKLADLHRVPVVPRGAGSGFSGGALAVEGGMVLTTRRLNRVLSVDEGNMTALVEAGVINGDLQSLLVPRGLFFPPTPPAFVFRPSGGTPRRTRAGRGR